MSAGTTRDGAISAQGARSGRTALIVLAILAVFALGGGALYWLSTSFGTGSATSKNGANKARSYRTLAKTELREEPNQAAKLVVSLREGTTVAGVPAGNQDGVDWLEITAVDGTKGFAAKTLFKELGPATAATEIRGGTRRLVTSAKVNLRETPSMSGRILGEAEGGTRLVSDGSIQSEGEDWLRVPLDGQTTVFIMQRYTTSDDDGGSSDGIEGEANTAIGVRGFATAIANVQATPLPDARVVRALQLQEEVRIIGQTNAGRAWYVLRLSDGSQGFAPREAIRLDPNANRWVYPDGTLAPGPNIPKGATTPVLAGTQRQGPVVRRANSGPSRNSGGGQSGGQRRNSDGTSNNTPAQPTPVPVIVPNTPAPAPAPAQPVEAAPVPGPQ
jgi:hypothetical protein